MCGTFDYDVFLSHNQADKPRVCRLAEQLRTAGMRVWFDEWVIQPGDGIYLAIERGLALDSAMSVVGCAGLECSNVLFTIPSDAIYWLT
jgi:hypothetical protein